MIARQFSCRTCSGKSTATHVVSCVNASFLYYSDTYFLCHPKHESLSLTFAPGFSSHPNQSSAVLLAIIVEKSKKCLDFSVTLFLIHLVSCIFYAGIPMKLDWWIVHVLGTIVMILLGEYLCSLKELSDIPLLEL